MQEILEVKGNLKLFKASWVKAHQDSNQSTNNLPLEAQLNVIADINVNAFQEHYPPSLEPSDSPVYITINDCIITGKLYHLLWDKYSLLDITTHTYSKTNMTVEEIDLIDWNNVGIALEQQYLNNKVQLVKFMHNWLNIGHQKSSLTKTQQQIAQSA
eukprot:1996383-Ditylum_brightwellii.AAC.1